MRREVPLVPLVVGRAAMPREGELPQNLKALSYRSGIRVRPDPDFHNDIDRLISGMRHYVRHDV